MPLNELELHPFLEFERSLDYNIKNITGIIIGSFPIYSITNSINHNGDIFERDSYEEAYMKFFYGSRKSKLWQILISIFNFNDFISNPDIERNAKISFAKQLLLDNNILMSDCIKATNRIDSNSEDSALLINEEDVDPWIVDNLELNLGLIDLLNNHSNIKNIYFTSIIENNNSPFSLFKQIFFDHEFIEVQHFQPHEKNWARIIAINGREYNIFFLPTPKSRTISFTQNRRHPFFNNYLETIDPVLFQQIQFPLNTEIKNRISEYRSSFLLEMYRQALIHQNLGFDGNM